MRSNGAFQQSSACDIERTAELHDPVDRVVLQLNSLCKRTTLEFALSVGRLIIHGLYNGDFRAWRHRGAKDMSFRRLARHRDLPMSPGSLYRSVAIYELCERMGITSWRHVSTSHLRLVLPLPRPQQEELIKATEANRWAVRRLEQEIAQLGIHHISEPRRGGRRERSRLRNTMHAIERHLDGDGNFVGLQELAVEASPDSVPILREISQRLLKACSKLESQLEMLQAGGAALGASEPPPDYDGERSSERLTSISSDHDEARP